MESIFNFFQGFFKDFTWSRFTFLFFTVLVGATGLISYEAYTNQFKLNRITNELKIAKAIVEIEKKINELPSTSTSRAYFTNLISEIENNPKEVNLNYTLPTKEIQKIAYQASPWAMILILALFATKDGRGSLVGGISVIAAPLIVVGLNLPELERAWLVNILYPWGTFTIAILLILYYQRGK